MTPAGAKRLVDRDSQRATRRPVRRFLTPVLLLVGLGAVTGLVFAPREREAVAPAVEPEASPVAPGATRLPHVAAQREVRLDAPPLEAANDPPPLHPHPFTSRHERIFRENEFVGQLFGAMDVKDGAGLRRLLAGYRREFPDDPENLQEGYRLIAECLEHPGPESRAAGEGYYDRERGSMLRRFVGRHCLENGD